MSSRAKDLEPDVFTFGRWSHRPLYPPSMPRRLRTALAPTGLGRLARGIRAAGGRRRDWSSFAVADITVDEQHASWVAAQGADLAIYPWPTSLALQRQVRCLVAVHDLQHLHSAHFPEVSAEGEAFRREALFQRLAACADGILVDSDVGKEDFLKAYAIHGAQAERTFVLPFAVAPQLSSVPSPVDIERIREELRLPKQYVLFPAAFWQHKNHGRFVDAAARVMRDEPNMQVVFTGAASNRTRSATHAEVLRRIARSSFPERFHDIGFVSAGSMAAVIAGARALALPTFFGPTNIPIVEAWAHGVPALTSDIRGIREQCQGAAVLVNPADVHSMAAGLEQLWCNYELRASLVAEGRRRFAAYGRPEFTARLWDIVERTIAGPKRCID